MVKTSVQTHLVRQWELLGPESPLFLWKEGLLFGWRIKSKPWSLCPRLPNMGHIHRHMLIGTRGPWSPEPSSSHTSCLCTHTHSRPISISSTPAYSQHVWENFSFSPPKSKILLSMHPKPSNLTDLLAYHSPDKHVKAIRTETGLACSSIWGPLVSHLNPLVSGPWGGPMGGMGKYRNSRGWGCQYLPVVVSLASLLLRITSSVLKHWALCLAHPRTFISAWDFGLLRGLCPMAEWFSPMVLVAQQPVMGNSLPQPPILSSYSCFHSKGGVRLLLPLCMPLFLICNLSFHLVSFRFTMTEPFPGLWGIWRQKYNRVDVKTYFFPFSVFFFF